MYVCMSRGAAPVLSICTSRPLSLVRARATFHYTFLYKPLHFQHRSDDEDCQNYDDRLRIANFYCFRAELSAKGAKRGVETTPEVFSPDDLPRPSRPKAGLGLVMIMKMIVYDDKDKEPK